MKQFLLFFVFFCFCLTASAQIKITTGTEMPDEGFEWSWGALCIIGGGQEKAFWPDWITVFDDDGWVSQPAIGGYIEARAIWPQVFLSGGIDVLTLDPYLFSIQYFKLGKPLGIMELVSIDRRNGNPFVRVGLWNDLDLGGVFLGVSHTSLQIFDQWTPRVHLVSIDIGASIVLGPKK